MAEESENLTLRLLQDIRGEMQALRQGQQQMQERLDDLTQRIDGNTLVFNLVAGEVHDHEERLQRLEQPDR